MPKTQRVPFSKRPGVVPSHYIQLGSNNENVQVLSSVYEQHLEKNKTLLHLMGMPVEITLRNNSRYSGILSSFNVETGEYGLIYVRTVPKTASKPVEHQSFLSKDIVLITCNDFNPAVVRSKGLPPDYTTIVDRSKADFKKKEAEAIRLSNEILKAGSSNLHVAEERGQNVHGADSDEEEIYSSVIRKESGRNPSKTPEEYEANLKKFELMAKETISTIAQQPFRKGKLANLTVMPASVATAIRKTSIDHIASANPRTPKATSVSATRPTPADPLEKAALAKSKAAETAASFDRASLDVSKEKFSAHLAKQPIEELKKTFKPFAKEMKSHLTERKQTIQKEGRKAVVEDFKAFASGFKIPEFRSGEGSPSSSERPELPAEPKQSMTNSSSSATVSTPPRKTASPAPKKAVSTTSTRAKSPAPMPPKHDKHDNSDAISVVSEAESHATNATNATSASKSKFKLSAAATEFTPSGFSAPAPTKPKHGPKKNFNKMSTSPGCKCVQALMSAIDYQNQPYYDYNNSYGYPVMMRPPGPRGYPPPMPMPPMGYNGQPFIPAPYAMPIPAMYVDPNMRPPPHFVAVAGPNGMMFIPPYGMPGYPPEGMPATEMVEPPPPNESGDQAPEAKSKDPPAES
ncbi:hypothetical protein HDU91_005798 [Kappamyces sp. JEL0680]|nr:hypothetical protein HDU91_005798 [Kappamyces sp. JEL0680]